MHFLSWMVGTWSPEDAIWAETPAGRDRSAGEFLYAKCLRDGIGDPGNLEAAAAYSSGVSIGEVLMPNRLMELSPILSVFSMPRNIFFGIWSRKMHTRPAWGVGR
jgi:hypothetical protein